MATDAVITFNYAGGDYCIAIYKKTDCFLDKFIPNIIAKSLIKSNFDAAEKGRYNWQNIVLETVYDIVDNEHSESGKIGNIKIVGDLKNNDFNSFIWKVDITPISEKYANGKIPILNTIHLLIRSNPNKIYYDGLLSEFKDIWDVPKIINI